MEKRCPICNASSAEREFAGEICVECLAERLAKTAHIPESVTINICRSCGKVGVGKEFFRNSNRAISEAIEHQLLPLGFKVKAARIIDNHVSVRFYKDIDDEEVGFTRSIRVRIRDAMCTQCTMKSGGYYQAVVQLRGDLEKIEKMKGKITQFVERRDEFISKVVKHRSGYDMYVSDKHTIAGFFSAYRINPTKSFVLAGVKSGKKVYRNIYSVKL